uniref:Uncharacterized protein n=1 Tax=Timema genevievae TaxID=629358 RepID=A0A7R9K8Z3_TIMGE|nr:unnamed protein product [Timema genevievae]
MSSRYLSGIRLSRFLSFVIDRGSSKDVSRHFQRYLNIQMDLWCGYSEEWYKDHPDFKVLYDDADGDGKKDFGDRRIFDQVNVNRKRS